MAYDEHADGPPSSRWPVEFDKWPHEDQLREVEMRMTRKGLIRELLSQSGLGSDQYDLRDDTKLTKKELAAIYLGLAGLSNTD